ncbi:MAG: DNA alkylation repair protein [Nocardioides sp.]
MTGNQLVDAIRDALATAGDPQRALRQQAYMKSEMPYRGLTSPELTALLKPRLVEFRPTSRADWAHAIRVLWDEAGYREDRYAAIAVARLRHAGQWRDLDALPLFRHLVTTGAWWDYVDEIAAHLVGDVLRRHREPVTPVMREWAGDANLWVRRTAVLCQLRHRSATDPGLLREVIGPNLGEPSFWLRKAIGWALREYARTDPDWVRAAVAGWTDEISNLSRREALKHLAPASATASD